MPIRGTASAAIALLAALSIAGCTSDAPQPSPTDSSSGVAEPTATPTPTPAPAWIIDGSGIGPVKVGAAIEDVAAAIPDFVYESEGMCGVGGFDGPAFDVSIVGDDVTIAITNLVAELVSDPALAPRTAAGITVGSTEPEVRAAYPEVSGRDAPWGGTQYPVPMDGRYVVMYVVDGRVEMISVTDLDFIPIGYC